ncbi:MAG: AAA family ATPase [Planctomycetaceae bacterium]|nr:AAA family ATPase [Planctomycetaceae bacterium]
MPDLADLKERETFDTREWEDRLDELTDDDIQGILKKRLHLPSVRRVQELRTKLCERYARRNDIIHAMCCAAIAQIPAVLIGPPGTAKSALVRGLCEGLGLSARKGGDGDDSANAAAKIEEVETRRYFEYLLTRFTTPEEVVGPWHIQDLIHKQQYRRVTRGHLPEARIAFLDEIFKASSAILNTLLTLLNEKIFYNGGRAVSVPLLMAFAASNEMPTDETLKALLDRFPLRIPCPRVEPQHRRELILRAWELSYDRHFSRARIAIEPIACTNDLRLLNHVARVAYRGREALGKDEFDRQFLRFFDAFSDDVSDRTAPQLLAFARAEALLGDDKSLDHQKHLSVFKYVGFGERHLSRVSGHFGTTRDRLA